MINAIANTLAFFIEYGIGLFIFYCIMMQIMNPHPREKFSIKGLYCYIKQLYQSFMIDKVQWFKILIMIGLIKLIIRGIFA